MSDLIVYLKSELYEFSYLQQNAFDKEDAYCPLDRQISLFELIQKIFSCNFNFDEHDEARNFFISLQNDIKNMNFMTFESDAYKEAFLSIENRIATVT